MSDGGGEEEEKEDEVVDRNYLLVNLIEGYHLVNEYISGRMMLEERRVEVLGA
jgi:hypothetical protein